MVDIRNIVVLMYIIIGYMTSISILVRSDDVFLILFGTLLLAHVLCWSGYMHHELCHYSVFEKRKWNIYFGRLLDWLNGACYWPFEELREQHVKHHVYKVDYDTASGIICQLQANSFFNNILLWSEYFYIPSHAFIIHWRSVLAPWWSKERKSMRLRTVLILMIRTIYFFILYYLRDPLVLVCYFIAYSISIQIIRFTDAFSHTYEVVPVDTPRKYQSKMYDMSHTYTIEFETNEQTSKIVKLLAQFIHVGVFLNFNFHNQHHYSTQKKWFELGSSFITNDNFIEDNQDENVDDQNNQPNKQEITTHQSNSGSLCGVPKNHYTISLSAALRAFHIHRLKRIYGDPGKPFYDPISKIISLDNYYGVADASVLVLEL
ncbi:unnamed protein product [Adineta steineri]|uniref:Fatty acid desaturase domain-containing protein n=1 Tax=Adineta steineri TaxID=433720 RepID=A0A819SB67_9BILA|nr:unnamed protein product [Adineta steineri]CAF4058666.1 unnamed protein product [Adineta steineri]